MVPYFLMATLNSPHWLVSGLYQHYSLHYPLEPANWGPQ